MSQAGRPAAGEASPYRNANLFSGHYLDERVSGLPGWDCNAEARAAFEALWDLWQGEGDLVASYNEDELLDAWIDEVLAVLGFDTLSETPLPDGGGFTDRLLFASTSERRAAAREQADRAGAAHERAGALLEAKRWDASFTERFSEERSYRDASHQVKYYLERTPAALDWAILTNGKQWRLYGTKEYETRTYYEVDLPRLLETGDLEEFKYFYTFFRPAAFRESGGAASATTGGATTGSAGGTTFLDTVWAESETAAEELGEDLQDNVFTALRVLGEGFVETNELSIDFGDDERLGQLKDQSLVCLYRLMFVLYAESRGLIHPDGPRAEAEYDRNFSLDALRHEVLEEVGETPTDRAFEAAYSRYATGMWSRFEDLFSLIDTGNDDLGIPPYNGGLFDEETHEFLATHEVADRHLAEVVYRLSTTATGEGSGYVAADYADLDTRHLGTIYEGLLEHEFAIAPEEYAAVADDGGQVWKPAAAVSVAEAVETVESRELYVVNDEGERKATGAYYTPDYVVTYIVEETIGPLIDGIDADLRDQGLTPSDGAYFAAFWRCVTDLRILDPAMGSGHFLTRATGYLTEQVMRVVREQEIQGYAESDLRRRIAKECIYGVDINGMAVELAKLSMWLETLAADQPLAFLDHHLKTGNSLVGSDIAAVLSDGASENDDADDGPAQVTLAYDFARTRRRALDHVMDLTSELLAIDNESLQDIHSMKALYDEIRADPLYGRLFAMANVHTASQFGLDVPEDAAKQMARAIEDPEDWAAVESRDWFRSAQELAREEGVFHWELEFPEVFFDVDGERLESAGFDAVVGNPPYVNIVSIPNEHTTYLRTYSTAFRRFDLYVLFSELAMSITRREGYHSFIVPDKALTESYAQKWREDVLSRKRLQQILDLRDVNVFEDATNSPIVYILKNDEPEETSTVSVFDSTQTPRADLSISAFSRIPEFRIRLDWTENTESVLDSIRAGTIPLSRIMYASWGAQPGNAERFVFEEDQPGLDNTKQMIKGSDISRYRIDYSGRYLWYDEDELHRPAFPELFENEKICLRKVAGEQGLIAGFDDQQYYTEDSVINLIRKSDLAQASDDTLSARGVEVVDEHRPTESGRESLVYDRDSTIYLDDLELSNQVSVVNLLGVLNSSTIEYYYKMAVSGRLNVFPEHIRTLPFKYDEEKFQVIGEHVDDLLEHKIHRANLNLDLFDHLGNYDDGPTLTEIGFSQPPAGVAASILHETTETRTKLSITEVAIDRDRPGGLTIAVGVRYKPEKGAATAATSERTSGSASPEAHETDQYGYRYLDPVAALALTDLEEREADLIEAFVPVAVEEAGGFAGFRATATKTISPMDRLEELTLPDPEDVADSVERYRQTRERAQALGQRIERTDALIDQIVYELYGLTDEEIQIVEEAVGE